MQAKSPHIHTLFGSSFHPLPIYATYRCSGLLGQLEDKLTCKPPRIGALASPAGETTGETHNYHNSIIISTIIITDCSSWFLYG